MRITRLTRQAAVLAAVGALGALGLAAPAIASAAATTPAKPGLTRPAAHGPAKLMHAAVRPTLPAGERYVCPAPSLPGQMTCMSIVNTRAGFGFAAARHAASEAALANDFYGPSDLRSAYKLTSASASDGKGRTVAIVDAYNDPNAARDLAKYRSHFHLTACGTSNGCLKIVNQNGNKSPLPAANADWAMEESLDLDMVSAICPNCHILLVEAKGPSTLDLGTAEDTAVRMGAKYVSNSWSGGEFVGQASYNQYFDHPGVAVDFASGDFGYGAAYPTDLQYVTAIGGTSLTHASNSRGWNESVWGPGPAADPEGTGSGCSTLEAKATWQRVDASEPDGCLNRTENDVSAVANPDTGVAIYDSYKANGLFDIGGTSAATPIITAVYALAGTPTPSTYPAEYPYLHSSHLFDVTTGTNGKCESFRQYLCHGEKGYDGPTGLGTPDGTGAFTDGGAHRVTVIDPGTQDVPAGGAASLTVTGLYSAGGTGVHYSATGLPAGLKISTIGGSTNAEISGTLKATPGDHPVTVTGKDGSATSTTHFTFVVVPDVSQSAAAVGEISSDAGQCLDDGTGTPTAAVRIQPCTVSASQDWKYTSDGTPYATGTITVGTDCLGLSSEDAQVQGCAPGAADQDWAYLGSGVIDNLSDGECLASTSLSGGARVEVARCTGAADQTWSLPAGPIVAGTSTCLADPGISAIPGTAAKMQTCGNSGSQQWELNGDGTIASSSSSSSSSGLCLSNGGSLLSESAITVEPCDNSPSNPDYSEIWIPGPGGELINAQSGRCLDDKGSGPAGSAVIQYDCYGEDGEVWGLN